MVNKKKKHGMMLFFILLLLLVGMVFIGTEMFQIKKITVLGNDNIVYNEITRLSGIVYGDNIFKLNKNLVKERIENNPYLVVLDIVRNYPDEVVINVDERKPAAVIPYLGSYILIDADAVILEINKELDTIEYPLIQDVNVQNFIVGKQLIANNSYQIKVMKRILEGIYHQGVQDNISEILLKDTDDIYLVSQSGMSIRIGQAIDIDNKLKWLNTKEIEEIGDGHAGSILDISVANKPIINTLEN